MKKLISEFDKERVKHIKRLCYKAIVIIKIFLTILIKIIKKKNPEIILL